MAHKVFLSELEHDSFLTMVWPEDAPRYDLMRVDRHGADYTHGSIVGVAGWDQYKHLRLVGREMPNWVADPVVDKVVPPGGPHHTALVALEMMLVHGARNVRLPDIFKEAAR